MSGRVGCAGVVGKKGSSEMGIRVGIGARLRSVSRSAVETGSDRDGAQVQRRWTYERARGSDITP